MVKYILGLSLLEISTLIKGFEKFSILKKSCLILFNIIFSNLTWTQLFSCQKAVNMQHTECSGSEISCMNECMNLKVINKTKAVKKRKYKLEVEGNYDKAI